MLIFSHPSRFFGKHLPRFCAAKRGPFGRGFTLIELLLVLAVITVLTAVFLFQQNKFDSSTLLRSLAYSIALSVRQAQIYGTSVRQFGSTFSNNYGLYFSMANGNTGSYVLFADANGNGQYDPSTETVQTFNISGKFHISDICADSSCNSNSGITWLMVYFKRPNPDALFKTNSGSTYSKASITVTGSGGATRQITITSTGQISVCPVNQSC